MTLAHGETIHTPQPSLDDESLRLLPNPSDTAHLTDPEAALAHSELRAVIDEQLAALNSRAATVVRDIYGLNKEGQAYTYPEVAEAHGVTPRGARIIVANALRTLRGSPLSQYVKDDPAQNQEQAYKPCEDVFSGIAVLVHDDYDHRPYTVRLKEVCDKWLAEQLVEPAGYVSGYTYRQITASLKPNGLYIHDAHIDNTDAANEHYAAALTRLSGIRRSIKFFMHYNPALARTSTLENLLARGTLTHEDLPYVLDINLSDPEAREAAIAKRMRMTVPEVVAQLAAAKKAYESYRRSIKKNPDHYWKSGLPRITKLYNWDTLFALGINRDTPSCSKELRELLAARERILKRPVTPGTEQSQEASLIILDTKIKYYRRIAKIYNVQSGDKQLFALLPHYY